MKTLRHYIGSDMSPVLPSARAHFLFPPDAGSFLSELSKQAFYRNTKLLLRLSTKKTMKSFMMAMKWIVEKHQTVAFWMHCFLVGVIGG